MSERAKFRGMQAELEDRERLLKTKADGLVESLRDQVDPFVDPGTLKEDIIASQATDLASAIVELKKVRAKISAIKSHLRLE